MASARVQQVHVLLTVHLFRDLTRFVIRCGYEVQFVRLDGEVLGEIVAVQNANALDCGRMSVDAESVLALFDRVYVDHSEYMPTAGPIWMIDRSIER